MKIQIILIGKNKDKWIDIAINDFLKKLKAFAEISIEILKDEKIAKSQDSKKIKEIEGNRILEKVLPDNFLFVLDETGKLLSSEQLAQKIEKNIDFGKNMTFVIGGALGLSEKVKQRADLLLSFSKMTFTHQMIRIFLLEQIYRSFNILKGTQYHK